MRIIPAIDIIDGKCVRLTQGDYAQKKVYNENPVDVAKSFQDAGLKYLHLVDLDGAKAGKVINWKVAEAIAAQTTLEVDFGGGIKTDEEIKKLFELGIKQVNLGSIAVKEPEKVKEWIKQFGFPKIILSADIKNYKVAINGWQEDTSVTIDDFLKDYVHNKGIEYVVCTDISTDGMLSGPNIDLYKWLMIRFPQIHLIASGGVSSLADLKQLKQIGTDAVIVGKAIYENKVSLTDLVNL
ncbi:MAG TPA: 1-(5-phosphoribosyl)-5-[(5-phosphoribosylamino)methylideneamino]imidazole-4-carboxamide isomerase [Ohtaekwangia sp.]